MPTFILAAAIAAGTSAIVAGSMAAFVSTFATYAILGAVSYALTDNDQPNTGSGTIGSQGRLVTVRQPISYRQVIVGRARVGGTITYIEQVGSDLHMIITWAGHVCQSIDEIWFGDELQTLNGSGDATTGSFAETSFTETLVPSGAPTTATLAHTPIGATSLWVTVDDQVSPAGLYAMTDVSPAEPATAIEYKRSGTTVTFLTGTAGTVVATYNVSVADVPPPSGTPSYIRIQNSLGDEAGQPFPDLVTASDGKWTNAHRQTGCTKSYIRLTANPEKFPNGIPNITAVIKGAKVYDPRTAATAWSNNAALWISHYLTNTDYGLAATYATEIDATDLTAAANVCDEDVALAGSPTTYENRYEANGAFLTSERPKDVIGRLLGAMAGRAVAAGEKWHIHAGAYEVPTVTIAEDDIIGPTRCQPIVSRRDSCNGVKGIFTDPNSSWQPTDFPPYPAPGSAYDTWIALDNNERVWRDVDFSAFVTSGTQAQRLAKIELLRTRYAMAETVPCKLTAYAAMTGRTVGRTDTQMGWTAEPFDVNGSQFTVAADGALGVELSLQRTASAVYDWSTAEEQAVAVAGDPTLPDPYPGTGTPAGSVPSVTIADTTIAGTSEVVGDQAVGGNQTVTGAVNGLTLTAQAVGFTITGGTIPATLTHPADINAVKMFAHSQG